MNSSWIRSSGTLFWWSPRRSKGVSRAHRAFFRTCRMALAAIAWVALQADGAHAAKANPTARTLLADNIAASGVSYPFTFALISDTHIGCHRAPPTDTSGGICSDDIVHCDCYDAFDLLLDSIASHSPEFVINCGDYCEGGSIPEHHEWYRDRVVAWMSAQGIPVFSIMGNHDILPPCTFLGPGGFEFYEQYLDDVQYTGPYGVDPWHKYWDYYFDYGTFRFIMVDNVSKEYTWNNAVLERVTASQLEAIEPWVSGGPANRFLFTHITLLAALQDTAYDYPGYDDLNTLVRNSGARAAFAGHKHPWAYQDPADCGRYEHFLVAAGCPTEEVRTGFFLVTVSPPADEPCHFLVDWHKYNRIVDEWAVLRVYPPGELSVAAKTVTGSCEYFGQMIKVATAAKPVVVEPGGQLDLVAGDSILLRPGFSVQSGGGLKAVIKPCVSNNVLGMPSPGTPTNVDPESPHTASKEKD